MTRDDERLQEALQALRYAAKPVVTAVHGMVLGGGCEVAMGTNRLLAAAESYLGQVEAGVGLVPAGGGLKELVRRLISPAMTLKEADPLPVAQKVFETVAMAKTSTSAAEAAESCLLLSQLLQMRQEVTTSDGGSGLGLPGLLYQPLQNGPSAMSQSRKVRTR